MCTLLYRFRLKGWVLAGWMLMAGHEVSAQTSAFDAAFEDGDSASSAPFGVEHAFAVQTMHERARLPPVAGSRRAERQGVEARLDLNVSCEQGWCDGARAVLKPRLWLGREKQPGHLPTQKPDHLPQAYVLLPWKGGEIGAGQHLLGWGPSMIYSPTNRLFPDNGSVSPRREVPGKPMVFGSVRLSGRGRLQVVIADPRLDTVAGVVRGDGPFMLLRNEWTWYAPTVATLGLVAGGGGAFRPYVGAYGEIGVTDSLTLSAEMAASDGYARSAGDGTVLRQDQTGSLRWDGTLGIRHGFSSGAEIGIEFMYNGYAMTPDEQRNPMWSAMPSAGHKPSRNRALHPYVQGQYLMAQTSLPKLFGDRRWGLTARWLQGLDRDTSEAFLELSFSPADDATLYLGMSASRVPAVLRPERGEPRSWYAAVGVNF